MTNSESHGKPSGDAGKVTNLDEHRERTEQDNDHQRIVKEIHHVPGNPWIAAGVVGGITATFIVGAFFFISARIGDARTSVSSAETRLEQSIQNVKDNLGNDIHGLRDDLREDMSGVRQDVQGLRNDMHNLLLHLLQDKPGAADSTLTETR